MKRRIGVQGFFIFLALLCSIIFSAFLFPNWKKEVLDEVLDIIGVGLILLGFLFRIGARGYKSEISSKGDSLIVGGFYNLMRHPMYFGTLLIGLGVVAVLFKWWVSLFFILIFLLIYIPQIDREEDKLYIRFGDEYRDYSKKTPKYFPNIFRLFRVQRQDTFFKWQWVKKELFSLVGVIIGIIFIELWEDVRLFGYGEFINELLEFLLTVVIFTSIFILCYEAKAIPRKD